MLLTNIVQENLAAIDSILRQKFSKQLFYPKEDDQKRLLKLKMWSERHKVSLSYILAVLIPHFEKMAYKHSRNPRQKISKGIGTTISILTGPAAEEYLAEQILKDYPDGEHLLSWKEEKKQECLRKIEIDEGNTSSKKPKGILQYKTLAAFRKAYVERIKNNRFVEDRLVKQLARQPFRGNPWR